MVAVQEQTVSVWKNQINPKVHVAGSGPALVFLHGAYGLTWDPFLDTLAEQYTVYAPEHPGTTLGDPDGVKALDDLWDLVLYYDELFEQLGLHNPAVIGHSFGGMVASELAACYPQRVGKLVLLNPIGLWRDDVPVKNWMILPLEEVVKAAFYDAGGPPRPADADRAGGRERSPGPANSGDLVTRLYRQVYLAHSRQRAQEAHPSDYRSDPDCLGH